LKNGVFWITGLPSSGKTSLGLALHDYLNKKGIPSILIDGDKLRAGLCKDLGYSDEDRLENIRRAAEIAKLAAEAGIWVICCLVSPMERMRRAAKDIISPFGFYEVYLNCPIEICSMRDVKGLYLLAREGKLANLTGISAPYEVPQNPNLTLQTGEEPFDMSLSMLCQWVDTIVKR